MNSRTIIALAPTGGWGRGRNNPVDPDVIAEDVIKCSEAGASVVHMHVRDENGNLSADRSTFDRAVEIIKTESDIILEASTGGLSSLTAEERIISVYNDHAELGSLNLGSLNFGDEVYKNSVPEMKFWISEMDKCNIRPSIEIFDTGHLETALYLIDNDIIKRPYNFCFIFNVRWGMSFSPAIIDYLKSKLPDESIWGAVIISTEDFSQHVSAVKKGAYFIRTGFEDSAVINGKLAESNLELVSALKKNLENSGIEIIRGNEARKIILR